MSARIKNVAVVVFDGIERLDYEGPLAVLGWTKFLTSEPQTFQLVSKHGRPVVDHLLKKQIQVDGATTAIPQIDLLLVPGGDIREFATDRELIGEVGRLGRSCIVLASVCTGAFLVAASGLGNRRTMVTHWDFTDEFRRRFSEVVLVENQRFYRDGSLWSSAGISAGIDMSLRLVAALWSPAIAKKVQGFMEYFPEPPYTRAEVIAARGSS